MEPRENHIYPEFPTQEAPTVHLESADTLPTLAWYNFDTPHYSGAHSLHGDADRRAIGYALLTLSAVLLISLVLWRWPHASPRQAVSSPAPEIAFALPSPEASPASEPRLYVPPVNRAALYVGSIPGKPVPMIRPLPWSPRPTPPVASIASATRTGRRVPGAVFVPPAVPIFAEGPPPAP